MFCHLEVAPKMDLCLTKYPQTLSFPPLQFLKIISILLNPIAFSKSKALLSLNLMDSNRIQSKPRQIYFTISRRSTITL